MIPTAVMTSIKLEKMGKQTRKIETAKNAIGYTKLTWEKLLEWEKKIHRSSYTLIGR